MQLPSDGNRRINQSLSPVIVDHGWLKKSKAIVIDQVLFRQDHDHKSKDRKDSTDGKGAAKGPDANGTIPSQKLTPSFRVKAFF